MCQEHTWSYSLDVGPPTNMINKLKLAIKFHSSCGKFWGVVGSWIPL